MAEKDFTGEPAATKPTSPPPRRKRRLILKIIGALLVLIILLILAVPTLISTSPVVSIALGQVNKQLNGKVDISSLSLGWFTGIKLEGVRVFDQTNAQIAELDHVTVPLPLWKAVLGKLDLGDVIIDGVSFDAKKDAQGKLNFSQLIKPASPPSVPSTPAPSTPDKKAQPSKLPNVSGNIKLTNCHGTLSQPDKPTIYLTRLNADIKIPDINQPIAEQIDAAINVGQQKEGTITATGTALVIANNQIALSGARVHQILDVKDLNLQIAGVDTLQGWLGLHLSLDMGDKYQCLLDATLADKNQTRLDPVHLDASCSGSFPNLQNLNLELHSKFANGKFQGTSLADLNGNLQADLNLLQSQLEQFVDLKKKTFGGTVAVTITDHGQLTQPPYHAGIQLDVKAANLEFADGEQSQFKQPLAELNVQTDLQGSAQNTIDQVKKLTVTLKTGDAKAPVTDLTAEVSDVVLSLSSKSQLDKVQSAHWQINVPDVKPIMDLANAFSSVTPVKGDAKAIPPLKFTSGTILIAGDLSHEALAVKLNVSQVSAKNVAIQRGQSSYAFKPVNLSLVAAVKTTSSASIDQLQITQLTGDLGFAALSMPAPITVSQLSTKPVADGAIKLVGNLTDLTQLLAAMQGQKADAYPYRGDYTLTENIGTQQDTISLKGGLQIAKFQSFNGSTVTFSEDLLNIANDVALATQGDDQSVTISNASAAMQSSGAVNISLNNGTIQHLKNAREIQLHPTVEYDLAKLWPIIQPMMGDKYKTLKIAGHFKKQFNITGSYPADQPSTVAIKPLHADGDLAVESFDYDGLTLQNFVVPFTLDNGQLVTMYTNKTTAAPATANGGTLDLGNLAVDLTQDPPRLTTPANKTLVNNLTINPLFSDSFLAKVINNPLFAGAKDASGLFALTVDDCTNLPMGNLVTLPSPSNSGKIDLRFSITKLHIGLATDALQSVLKQNTFEANVKDATVSVARGISTQHIKFATGDYTLGFDGSVRLKDQAFIPMTLTFPLAAIASKTHLVRDASVLAALPDSLAIPVEGTVSSPQYRFEKVIPQAITDATAKAIAGGLLGGNKNPDGSKNSDPLGGLLDRLQKKIKK